MSHSLLIRPDPVLAKILLVRYKGDTFNIFPFLGLHPGGKSILQKYENQDITRAFDDINHSELAKLKMKNYLYVDNLVTLDDATMRKRSIIDASFVYKKLVSKEDQFFIHKTLGLLSLLSYCYRYLYSNPPLPLPNTHQPLLFHFTHSLVFHICTYYSYPNPSRVRYVWPTTGTLGFAGRFFIPHEHTIPIPYHKRSNHRDPYLLITRTHSHIHLLRQLTEPLSACSTTSLCSCI